METKEFQKKCAEVVEKIDQTYKVERDSQLGLCQLMEEVGELAKELDKRKLRHKEPDMENLAGEFADIFLLFANLAKMQNVDLEEAVENKIVKLKKRGYLD